MIAPVPEDIARAIAERWYPLRPHAEQIRLCQSTARYRIVAAGRRSGKTERAKRHIVRRAMAVPGHYFLAAPTRDQVRSIFWDDLKTMTMSGLFETRPYESRLTIPMPNGSHIHLIGLDRPQRMEGISWTGGIVDEIADVRDDAWGKHISPALDTVDPRRPNLRAWCWLIGVPDGLGQFYELFQRAKTLPDWETFTWPSSDILPPDVIESAKRSLSAQQYRQEYEASFEGSSGRIYPDYGDANTTTETILPHEQLHWTHDFNYTPLSSCVVVVRGDGVLILDEIILRSAVARQSAMEFCEKFSTHKNRAIKLYGDPSGKAGEKHAQASDYTEIEGVLRANRWSVERCVATAAPAIKDRQNAVRAMILTADGQIRLRVNPDKAPWSHRGLLRTELKPGSSFLETECDAQHITTAIGYFIHHDYAASRAPAPAATWRAA